MKRIVLAVAFIMGGRLCYGAPATAEAPISGWSTPETLTVSNSAWTKATTTQLSGRYGIVVSVPAANNANMVGLLGNCTSTAVATTVRPFEFVKGGFTVVPTNENVCLWLMTLHSGSESAHTQQFKQ